jgi:nucleotide-binding universal stress UspA family protein
MVPVDFTPKNKWAIAKAVELANTFNCNIHFVHVVSSVAFYSGHYITNSNPAVDANIARHRLKALQQQYESHVCSSGKIEIDLLHGLPGHEMQEYIERKEIDLVIIGLSKFNLLQRLWSAISISALMQKTNVPVLAVRSSGLVSHFKKIVLPVNNEVPVKRIRLAILLGRFFKSTVYVLSLKNKDGQHNVPVLTQTLEIFQSLTTVPVQSIIVEGKSLAQSTIEFSKKINADLIMINPLKEFFMPGWWNRITQKLLSYQSRIPVLTVMQDHEK